MSPFLSAVYKAVVWVGVEDKRRRRDTFPVVLLLQQNREGRKEKRPSL